MFHGNKMLIPHNQCISTMKQVDIEEKPCANPLIIVAQIHVAHVNSLVVLGLGGYHHHHRPRTLAGQNVNHIMGDDDLIRKSKVFRRYDHNHIWTMMIYLERIKCLLKAITLH